MGRQWPQRIRVPLCYFNSFHEVIRLEVMTFFRFALLLRHREDMLHEFGIDIDRETARSWRLPSISQRDPPKAGPLRRCRFSTASALKWGR